VNLTHLRYEYAPKFKDLRLTRTFDRIVVLRSQKPAESIPTQLSPDDQRALYRLYKNPSFAPDDVLKEHINRSFARAQAQSNEGHRILCAHDTTSCEFRLYADDMKRINVPKLTKHSQGFDVHTSLLISANKNGIPLGIARALPWVSSKGLSPDENAYWSARNGCFTNEHTRWIEAVRAVEMQAPEGLKIVHLQDREGGDYLSYSLMLDEGVDFIIRAKSHGRFDKKSVTSFLEELTKNVPPLQAERVIKINARSDRKRGDKVKKTHPARRERYAKISFWWKKVSIDKTNKVPSHLTEEEWRNVKKSITLNMIHLTELNPPPGEVPVSWTLLTNMSIENNTDVFNYIDFYRLRWRVEDYFKSLKTGCSYLERQFMSADKLLCELAVTLPQAWWLLCARHLSEEDEKRNALDIIDKLTLTVLRMRTPSYKWPAKPTVRDVHWAVALLGGHRKSNGPPGWQTLGRGMDELNSAVSGARAILESMGKSF
jgi:hypothetical protein